MAYRDSLCLLSTPWPPGPLGDNQPVLSLPHSRKMSLPPYLTPNLRSSLIHFYSQTWSHALYLCNFASDPVDPRILGLHTPIPFPFLFYLSVLCAPLPAGCSLITCFLFLCLLAPHAFAQNVSFIGFSPDSVYSFPHSFLPVAANTA